MLKAIIFQTEDKISTNTNFIGNQFSSNIIELQILKKDSTFDDFFIGIMCGLDRAGNEVIELEYDFEKGIATLPFSAVQKYGSVFISMYGVKNDRFLTTNRIEFRIGQSNSLEGIVFPYEPEWQIIVQQMIEQINENEYRKPIYELIAKAQADIDKFIADGTVDMEELKKSTTGVLDKLKLDYATYINNMTTKYDQDRVAMLENAAKQIQAMKDSANAAINTMIKNANIDFKALKDTTTTDVNNLKKQAQAQQTQINVSKQSMDTLQADLITKRDSGFFDGSDGALIPTSSGMFTLFKSGGHLKARVLKGTSEPPLIHKNGHLYYKKVKEV